MSRDRKLTEDTNIDTINQTTAIADIVARMRQNPAGVRFRDLCKVCEDYFGPARQTGGSHRVYKTPWIGDPRVNIQDDKGKAKPYQVKQVLRAIEMWEKDHVKQR